MRQVNYTQGEGGGGKFSCFIFNGPRPDQEKQLPPPIKSIKPHHYELIHTGLNFELEPQTGSLLENVCAIEKG